MKLQHNISLKDFNTFGIDANAKNYVSITSKEDLKNVIAKTKEIFVLGGGSNLLLTKDIDLLVVHINTKGITVKEINPNEVHVRAEAGENWHEFVLWCISKNFGGLENLSLIPGNVGTCPIQNIGAYGIEVKDTITEVNAIEICSGKLKTFTNSACEFNYRNSIFKNELKHKFIITSVTFKLTQKKHSLNYSYGAIKNELELHKITEPTIKDISKAVIKIRNSKLPDTKKIGNSGSFFKNPVVHHDHFKTLKNQYPNIPSYALSEKEYKIPAGWLIEQCGFKGKRFGETGSHQNQALVLVNYGNATGQEVYDFAQKIQKTVLTTFSIALEIEVNIIQ